MRWYEWPTRPATPWQTRALSSAQLDEIERKREAYLSEKPESVRPTGHRADEPAAGNRRRRNPWSISSPAQGRLLPGGSLSRIPRQLRCSPQHPSHDNITKWIVDPKEDSLEKLINVYDVLADEDCNIALVFNRTSSTTNVYLAVVDTNNTEDNIDVDNFTKRISDAVKGNFPGIRSQSSCSAVQSPAFRNVIHSQSPPCRMSRPRKTTGS